MPIWLTSRGRLQRGPADLSAGLRYTTPQCDAQEFRQYIHQVMGIFRKTDKEVVMVVDRSGIHRAKKLASTLAHYDGQLQFHLFPARCGHHLNPIEGFWRVMKDR